MNKKEKKKTIKSEEIAINKILNEWDPIPLSPEDEYIVETWGMDVVIGLIKNNGNISNLLGITTREFELDWYQFIEEKYLN